MANNSFVISNIHSQTSSSYESATNLVKRAFGKVQEVSPEVTAIDTKTMVFGAAFFASLCSTSDPAWTAFISTVFGVICRRECNWAGKVLEVFSEQNSSVKLATFAVSVVSLTILRHSKLLSHNVSDRIFAAALGFYVGFFRSGS